MSVSSINSGGNDIKSFFNDYQKKSESKKVSFFDQSIFGINTELNSDTSQYINYNSKNEQNETNEIKYIDLSDTKKSLLLLKENLNEAKKSIEEEIKLIKKEIALIQQEQAKYQGEISRRDFSNVEKTKTNIEKMQELNAKIEEKKKEIAQIDTYIYPINQQLAMLPYNEKASTEEYKKFVENYDCDYQDIDWILLQECCNDINMYISEMGRGKSREELERLIAEGKNQIDKIAVIEHLIKTAPKDVSLEQIGNNFNADLKEYFNKYMYMTEDQRNMYHYLFSIEGEESAEEYLKAIEDSINQAKGAAEAADFIESLNLNTKQEEKNKIIDLINTADLSDKKTLENKLLNYIETLDLNDKSTLKENMSTFIDTLDFSNAEDTKSALVEYVNNLSLEEIETSLMNFLKISGKGLGDGINNFFEGLTFFTKDNTVMSSDSYRTMVILQYLSEHSLLYDEVYEASSSIGNMLPAMAASAIVSLVATPAAGSVVGSSLMGVSAGGNAYTSARINGNSVIQSIVYGILSGGSEAVLGYFLGNIPGLSKASTSALVGLFQEGFEEFSQEWVDAVLQSTILQDEVDWNSMPKQALKSFVMGVVVSGVMNGSAITIPVNGVKKSIDVFKVLDYVTNNPGVDIVEAFKIVNEIDNSTNKEDSQKEIKDGNADVAPTYINVEKKKIDDNTSKQSQNQSIEQNSSNMETQNTNIGKINSNNVDSQNSKKNIISEKAKLVKNNINNVINNMNAKAISLSNNTFVNSVLTNPILPELLNNKPLAFLGLMTDVLYKKRAVNNVLDNSTFTQKILNEGMVHFTSSEDVADAIMDSEVLKAKTLKFSLAHPIKATKNNIEYIANQGKKAFLFAGIPSIEEAMLNVDIKPTMVGVRIKTNEAQLYNVGYRHLDDRVLIHDGDLELSSSESVEKVYVGLKYDETNGLHYEEITKEEYDNYHLDVDPTTVKKITGKWSGTLEKVKTQIQLSYGSLQNKLFSQENIEILDETVSNDELAVNDDVKNFLRNRSINVEAILQNPESEVKYVEQKHVNKNTDIYTTTIEEVSLADIVGLEGSKHGSEKTTIFDLLNNLFDGNSSDPIRIRSLSMLDYNYLNVLSGLEQSLNTDPINVAEISDGNYVINQDGRHRFAVLKLFYLQEMAYAKTPEQKQAIKDKYTIPVQVERVDVSKSSCAYLLQEINSNYRVKNSNDGIIVHDVENNSTTVNSVEEATRLISNLINSMDVNKRELLINSVPSEVKSFVEQNIILNNNDIDESIEVLDSQEKQNLNEHSPIEDINTFITSLNLNGVIDGKNSNISIGNASFQIGNALETLQTELKNEGITLENINSANLTNKQISNLCDMLVYYSNRFDSYEYVMEDAIALSNEYRDKANVLTEKDIVEKVNFFNKYIVDLSNLIISNNNLSVEIENIVKNNEVSKSSINNVDYSFTNEEKRIIVGLLQKTNNLQDLSSLNEIDYSDKLVLQKYLQSGAAKTLLNISQEQFNALDLYMSSSYKMINSYLDSGVDVELAFGLRASDVVRLIDEVMFNNKTEGTCVLQRAASISDFEGVALSDLPGTILTHNRNRSCSTGDASTIGTERGGVAVGTKQNEQYVKIDYICPAGTKAVNLGMITSNDVEGEVTLGRNQRIRYETVKMDGETACVLAVVLPEGVSENISIKDLVDSETYELISERYNLVENNSVQDEVIESLEMPKISTEKITQYEEIETLDISDDMVDPKFDKIIDTIEQYFEKEKDDKLIKLFKKNKNNVQLFKALIDNYNFMDFLDRGFGSEFISDLSIESQKVLIESYPHLFIDASQEVRNDASYIEELVRKQNSGEIDAKKIDFYSWIGDDLSLNKEYLLSIKDKSPLAFIKSIGKVDFSEDVIRSFFEEHYNYVSRLPEDLKYDFEFVASLIEKIPSQHLHMHVLSMSVDYLKLEPIKKAIIQSVGEKGYAKILLYSLETDSTQLKNFSADEFKKLIVLNPVTFYDVNLETGLFSSPSQKENAKLIKIINDVSKLTFSKIDTPTKFTSVLTKLSNALDNGVTNEQINEQVSKHWEQILPWLEQIDDVHRQDDGSLWVNADERCFYKIYNLLLGIQNNNLNDVLNVLVNSELRESPYAVGLKNVKVTDENLAFLQLSCGNHFFNSDAKTLEMYNNLYLRISELNNDPYNSVTFIDRISRDNNLLNLLSGVDLKSLSDNQLLNIYNYVRTGMNGVYKVKDLSELNDFSTFINNNVDKITSSRINDLKHKVLLKYFQIDLSMAENIIHSYLNSNNDASLYKEMPIALNLKQLLEKIVKAPDAESIALIEKQLSEQNVSISFNSIDKVVNEIKKNYGKQIQDSLYKTSQTSGVIDITNEDFNLLVHVIGAYGSAPVGDVYDSWNTKEGTSKVSICTSFISENNMGVAPTNEHSVVLGFNNLPQDYLELMSCQDLYSRGFSAKRQSNFMGVEDLKNNTRHGHNEIVIRRREGIYTESKVEPSYIICFDSINEESRIASEKFNVPILFVDRAQVAQKQQNDIIAKVEEFKTTLNPELISDIISEQENNKAGLRLVRPDLVEQYFNTEFRQSNVDTIYKAIIEGIKSSTPNAEKARKALDNVLEVEAKKFEVTKETPHRKNIFDIDYKKIVGGDSNMTNEGIEILS